MSVHCVKSSTIFISLGDTTKIYRSVDEIPPALRKKLLDSAERWDSATILIADRRGREEVVRAMRGSPGPVRFRFLNGLRWGNAEALPSGDSKTFYTRWLGAALLLAVAIFTFLAFTID